MVHSRSNYKFLCSDGSHGLPEEGVKAKLAGAESNYAETLWPALRAAMVVQTGVPAIRFALRTVTVGPSPDGPAYRAVTTQFCRATASRRARQKLERLDRRAGGALHRAGAGGHACHVAPQACCARAQPDGIDVSAEEKRSAIDDSRRAAGER